MKKFFLRIFVFVLLLGVFSFLYALLGDGYSDAYYLRFTSPKQTALILGISRAAQGLQPASFNSELHTVYPDNNIYNFAFSLGLSAYGPAYYKAIQAKLDKQSSKSFFVLEVTPWSISAAPQNPNDTAAFEENSNALNQLHFFNVSPNMEYMYKSYGSPYINVLLNKLNSHPYSQLHNDGWYEIKASMDSAAVAERYEGMIYLYKNDFCKRFTFSNKRLKYLEKLIVFLQQHGDVYLVRLPASTPIKNIETGFMPQFDSIISSVSKKFNVSYYNFMDSSAAFSYVDGTHLEKNSGKKVSEDIAVLIKKEKASQSVVSSE